MEKIISEIAGEFIKNLIKSFEEGEKSFLELEKAAFCEAKACSAMVEGTGLTKGRTLKRGKS